MSVSIILFRTYASSPPLLFVKPGAIDIGAFDKWTTNTFLQSGCDKTAVINAFNALKNLSANQEGKMIPEQRGSND